MVTVLKYKSANQMDKENSSLNPHTNAVRPMVLCKCRHKQGSGKNSHHLRISLCTHFLGCYTSERPRILCMTNLCSTTKLYPTPNTYPIFVLFFWVGFCFTILHICFCFVFFFFSLFVFFFFFQL